MKHVNLSDVVEANRLLMSMGAEDALPQLAASAIERSLELQSRIDRALAYSTTPNAHNSPHVRQLARILDGSITLEDEQDELIPEPLSPGERPAPRPVVEVHAMEPAGRPMAARNTKERKAFREWADQQGFDLPHNKKVPQHYLDAFDQATGLQHKPQRRITKGPRGKLRPGHGLEGRSTQQRLEIRQWIADQGIEIAPSGRIPQKYIELYDSAQAELRRMRAQQAAERQLQQQQQQPQREEDDQREHEHAS